MTQRISLMAICCFITFISWGQTDPNNVPKPPTEKLKIFEPYFGKYNQTMLYAGIKFSGTMEIKPAIKGWYVDWTILTKSEDNKIDREFRMMVTYDSTLNKYLAWGFETLPHLNWECTISTEGTDLIIEWLIPAKGDKPARILYDRRSKPSADEIKIVTELHSLDGKLLRQVGVTTATRIK